PRLLSLMPLRLRNLVALAPDGSRAGDERATPDSPPAAGATRLRAGFVTGCVQRVFFSHVNDATVRVLSAEGCEVIAPAQQGCCGALALHAGRDDEARAFARDLIPAFEHADVDGGGVN